jgi:hypothetical protein
MSGPHFRDYHLLVDEPRDQIFATTDTIAERVRKIGGTTLHSVRRHRRCSKLAAVHRLPLQDSRLLIWCAPLPVQRIAAGTATQAQY